MKAVILATKKGCALAFSMCLLMFAAACWGNTFYIFAKAKFAQYLIADAWQQTLAEGHRHKPWSWADTWPVARLQYPKGGQDLFVLAGASGSSLAFGPGHLDGSALPGASGTTVISAHRDTHFAFLGELKPGESLRIQDSSGRWHTYTTAKTEVRDSRYEPLNVSGNKNKLVLITCYPFGAINSGGPLRYVVSANKLI